LKVENGLTQIFSQSKKHRKNHPKNLHSAEKFTIFVKRVFPEKTDKNKQKTGKNNRYIGNTQPKKV
jgi:hypothetical protein